MAAKGDVGTLQRITDAARNAQNGINKQVRDLASEQANQRVTDANQTVKEAKEKLQTASKPVQDAEQALQKTIKDTDYTQTVWQNRLDVYKKNADHLQSAMAQGESEIVALAKAIRKEGLSDVSSLDSAHQAMEKLFNKMGGVQVELEMARGDIVRYQEALQKLPEAVETAQKNLQEVRQNTQSDRQSAKQELREAKLEQWKATGAELSSATWNGVKLLCHKAAELGKKLLDNVTTWLRGLPGGDATVNFLSDVKKAFQELPRVVQIGWAAGAGTAAFEGSKLIFGGGSDRASTTTDTTGPGFMHEVGQFLSDPVTIGVGAGGAGALIGAGLAWRYAGDHIGRAVSSGQELLSKANKGIGDGVGWVMDKAEARLDRFEQRQVARGERQRALQELPQTLARMTEAIDKLTETANTGTKEVVSGLQQQIDDLRQLLNNRQQDRTIGWPQEQQRQPEPEQPPKQPTIGFGFQTPERQRQPEPEQPQEKSSVKFGFQV